MTQKTKHNAEVAARRQAVAHYYLKRIDQCKIVELLKEDGIEVSQPTVSRDITYLINQWKKKSETLIDDLIAREAAELNEMEMEATGNYYDAKGRPPIDECDPGISSDQNSMEKWMLVRLKIKERRAKMLKLDGPQKVEIEGNLNHSGGINIYIPDNGRDKIKDGSN